MSWPRHAAPGRAFASYAEFYANSAYARFEQTHRRGGALGATLLRVRQEPIDLIDAAVPEVVFIHTRSALPEVLIDLGDGPVVGRGVPPDTLSVVPARTEARFKLDTDHDLTCLAMPAARLGSLLDEAGLDTGAFSAFFARTLPAGRAGAIVEALWHESRGGGPASSLRFDGLLLRLLAELADSAALAPDAPVRPEDRRIARAVDFVEAAGATTLSVAALAGVAGLSPAHFAACFRASTGETVWGYVGRRRLERAREMLLRSDEPIARIAYACGFSSQAHLTTAFRRRFAATPAALRRDAARHKDPRCP